MGIISWIVVGAIAGWLAGYLVKGDESLGVIGKIVLGIVGAVVGGFLAGVLTGGNDYITGINITTIVVAVIGAVIAIVVWNALLGRSRTGRGPIGERRGPAASHPQRAPGGSSAGRFRLPAASGKM
jgi:uncharacterized membrane protein YeaQ/YmgE (transglycosylase-associated protein family)